MTEPSTGPKSKREGRAARLKNLKFRADDESDQTPADSAKTSPQTLGPEVEPTAPTPPRVEPPPKQPPTEVEPTTSTPPRAEPPPKQPPSAIENTALKADQQQQLHETRQSLQDLAKTSKHLQDALLSSALQAKELTNEYRLLRDNTFNRAMGVLEESIDLTTKVEASNTQLTQMIDNAETAMKRSERRVWKTVLVTAILSPTVLYVLTKILG